MEEKKKKKLFKFIEVLKYVLLAVIIVFILYSWYKPPNIVYVNSTVNDFEERFHVAVQAIENRCKADGDSGIVIVTPSRIDGKYSGATLECLENILTNKTRARMAIEQEKVELL